MNEVKAVARRRSLGSKLNWGRFSPFTGDFGRCRPSCPISACRGSFRAKTTSALRGTVEILKSDIKMPRKQRHRAKRIWERLTSYLNNYPEKSPTSLEWHGDPIESRNIWIRKVGDCDEKQS